jgi:hypothetical protein
MTEYRRARSPENVQKFLLGRIDYAELRLRDFTILRAEFGHWHGDRGKIVFDSPQAQDTWLRVGAEDEELPPAPATSSGTPLPASPSAAAAPSSAPAPTLLLPPPAGSPATDASLDDLPPYARETKAALTQELTRLNAVVGQQWAEISTDSFDDPATLRTLTDIEQRMDRVRTYLESAHQLLSYYTEVFERVHVLLLEHGASPREADDFMTGFRQDFHRDLLVRLTQAAIERGKYIQEEFDLLQSRWGAWTVVNRVVRFDDRKSDKDWLDLLGRIVESEKRRSVIAQEFLDVQAQRRK